ncbi:hypothetical protein Q9966_002957 [Columba livia]|nr:hypothetical protein Q9966_002957 [Columba livia]
MQPGWVDGESYLQFYTAVHPLVICGETSKSCQKPQPDANGSRYLSSEEIRFHWKSGEFRDLSIVISITTVISASDINCVTLRTSEASVPDYPISCITSLVTSPCHFLRLMLHLKSESESLKY